MKTLLLAGILAVALQIVVADPLPDFYKRVDRVIWIVNDIDQVVRGWNRLGFQAIQDLGEVDFTGEEFNGNRINSRVRIAMGQLGAASIALIQPISGNNAYAEFKSKRGEGVFSMVHRAPTLEAFNAEIQRLKSLGVGVLCRGAVDTDNGPVSYVYFDTQGEGKYGLGLAHYPDSARPDTSPQAPGSLRLSQYAFVVKDLDAVSKYWEKMGFPAMTFSHGGLRDLWHRGKPGQFDQKLGWQRHGEVVYEWILPLQGPTVYDEHLQKHGEGFHHLAFDVDDIAKVGQEWTSLGFPTVQSGAWGEEGKPGSGRFSYSDTSGIGGVTVEFLWNFPSAR